MADEYWLLDFEWMNSKIQRSSASLSGGSVCIALSEWTCEVTTQRILELPQALSNAILSAGTTEICRKSVYHGGFSSRAACRIRSIALPLLGPDYIIMHIGSFQTFHQLAGESRNYRCNSSDPSKFHETSSNASEPETCTSDHLATSTISTMTQPILIIGAGISGLTLAQACRKQNVAYRLFERDTSATHRSAGWGLTLNWSLPTFKSLIPEDVLTRLPETYVNKAAVDAGERGSFTFFDLSTGEAKWNVPASERIRVSRERLRKLMLTGLEVEWGKNLTDAQRLTDSGVKAVFDDGTEVEGSFLIACDGANSVVRKVCHPEAHETSQLPVRFIGAGVHYTEAQVAEMRKLDPYFLQGSDPRTDAYLWFSFLNTPSDPLSSEGKEGTYYCQIMTSWPYRAGFAGRADPTDIPNTKTGQLSWMKFLAENWAEPFRSVVQNITQDSEVMPIHLADWLPRRTTAFDGRVVLLGDAAHSMVIIVLDITLLRHLLILPHALQVMYRGEGANHAIVDVDILLKQLKPVLEKGGSLDDAAVKSAVESYEAEMIERTELAVLASRRACLDAHDWSRLNDQSPLVRRRLMRADLEVKQ